MKLFIRWTILVIILILAYPAWLGYQIWSQSHNDELHSADAIVVLGAAQYDGDPSPILKARLDHAIYLYDEGFSATVFVTGGKQPGDRFTEAEAGRMYLESNDVPPEDIVAEAGDTTLESLQQVEAASEGRGIESVLLVSDPLHSERIKRMAVDLGLDAYTSPASYLELDRSRATKARELVREIASLLAYELLGR
ncbi:MAG TPA: YdcF family protein [Actinomycetota bacterium]|nr:YdcF family protein [Actinomycetota bacterium]